MPFNLYFFLKKSVFPSMKTLFEIKSYAGPDAPGVRLFCFSPYNLHTIVGGGEMGNQPRDGGCNHMNSATQSFILWSQMCHPNIFRNMLHWICKVGTCSEITVAIAGSSDFPVQEEGRVVEALHLSVGSKSTGCTKLKEIIRLIKALSVFYYPHILSF